MHKKYYSFNSYENKQERPIKLIAKKLDHICEVERIEYDLKHE